ncbi:MAG TPA: hypothetical protein VMF58_08020 [Rhizomicrobium sp.]|nr:hypothetical protein [Rhizomicrobium sp.]
MYEFPSFVYLDMEKTGSSFIFVFLGECANEEAIRRKHHMPMEEDCDRSKFYFISVRDPLDAYISLYSFGCQSRGKVFARLSRRGMDKHYDGTTKGFNRWLKHALRTENTHLVSGDQVSESMGELLGPQSYRYLRLAVPGAREKLEACTTREEVFALYEKEKLPSFIVRHESFVKDLAELVRGPLRNWVKDVDAAVKYVETEKPRNSSDRVDQDNEDFTINPRLLKRLREREWFLHEIFGY